MITRLQVVALQMLTRILTPKDIREDDDRGDVPGWVMITIMSAILVVAIIAIFRDNLTDWITSAFKSVK